MTWVEFLAELDGYKARQKATRSLAAWHAANLMNLWSKKKVKPEHLLGKRSQSFVRGSGTSGKEQFKAEMRRRKADKSEG